MTDRELKQALLANPDLADVVISTFQSALLAAARIVQMTTEENVQAAQAGALARGVPLRDLTGVDRAIVA